MADDDPGDVAGERFAEALFGEHPLARPIGGSPESIEGASRDRVVGHYREHYRPSELVVTAAGAIDHEALVDAVVRGLAQGGWDMSVSVDPVPRRSTTPAALTGTRPLVVVDRPLEQVNLILGTPGITATDAERPELAVLSTVLGGGMSSRLFQEIRERRGLVYSVYSFAPGYSDAGFFGMSASCTPRKVREVVDVMAAELERMATEPISEEELTRAVGNISGSGALALEDSDARMNRLGRAELSLGEFIDLDAWTERIAQVTPEGVQRLAARLASSPRVLSAVGPVTEDVLG